MGLTIQNPLPLLVIPGLLLLIWWLRRQSSFVTTWRAVCLFGTGLGLTCSIVSPVIYTADPGEHRILIFDVSRSVSPRYPQVRSALKRLLQGRGNVRRVSVMLFGEDREWVVFRKAPETDALSQQRFSEALEDIQRSDTRPVGAFETALQEVRSDETTRILFVSDGRFENKALLDIIHRTKRSGVPVSTMHVGESSRDDLWIQTVEGPTFVQEGKPFEVLVRIGSSGTYTGRVHLDPGKADSRTVTFELNPDGVRTFRFRLSSLETAYRNIRVRVETEQPEWTTENNRASLGVRRAGTKRLLWYGRKEIYQPLVESLREDGWEVDLTGEPTRTEGYDLFVIAGPAEGVSSSWMDSVRSAILNRGTGGLMIGNPETFAAGRWRDTPVEKVLPVRVYPPDTFAIDVVLDVSGSMGKKVSGSSERTRLQVVRDALLSTLDFLRPDDKIELLTFAANPRTVMAMKRLGNGVALQTALERLSARGGTHLYPAFQKAIDHLRERDEDRKYIFIFSDAQLDESKAKLEKAAEIASEENIRILAVTSGKKGNRPLLETLTREGENGSVVYVSDLRKLQNTLQNELRRIRRLIQRNSQHVRVVSDRPEGLLGSNRNDLPSRSGVYHRVTPRPAALTPMQTKKGGEVLLAAWQPGAGRTVVLCPFLPTRQEQNRKIQRNWTRVLRDSIQWAAPESSGPWTLLYRVTDKKLIVYADRKSMPDQEVPGTIRARGRLRSDDGSVLKKNIQAVQVGTGRIRFEIERPEQGGYLFTANIRTERTSEQFYLPVNIPFSREYLNIPARTDHLRTLARETGGTFQSGSDTYWEALDESFQKGRKKMDLTRYMLIGAGVFLLLMISELLVGLLPTSGKK